MSHHAETEVLPEGDPSRHTVRPRSAKSLSRALHTAWEYLKFGLDFFVLRREHPYVLGLVTNDTCNLHCRHCRVANILGSSMRRSEIQAHLEKYYRLGARFLYLEGGESYLWRDGDFRLQDIIDLAREIGYFRVHLYTNGTFPLTAKPDFTWVSIDGLEESFHRIRGVPLERVLKHIRGFKERFAVVFVINTINLGEIRPFLKFIKQDFPQTRVMFFFHTPYYGKDELFLSPAQKQLAIETLLQCKAEGLPVLNSRAGLKAILTGNYMHPARLWWVVDQTGEYPCCRSYQQPEVCEHCGYSSCAELVLSRSLNPQALATMLWNI